MFRGFVKNEISIAGCRGRFGPRHPHHSGASRCALCNQAARDGVSVLYKSLSRLLDHTCCCSACRHALGAPSVARATIIDNANGTFSDTALGLTFADHSVYSGLSYNQVVSALDAGSRFATLSEADALVADANRSGLSSLTLLADFGVSSLVL